MNVEFSSEVTRIYSELISETLNFTNFTLLQSCVCLHPYIKAAVGAIFFLKCRHIPIHNPSQSTVRDFPSPVKQPKGLFHSNVSQQGSAYFFFM